MAYPVDEIELKQVFDAFDEDHSGMVSTAEVHKMALSLGMVFSPEALASMVGEADIDGNGEIDFEEFKTILKKTAESAGTSKGFGALALRKKNAGPPMKWRSDKKGPGVELEGDVASRAAGSKGFGAQLTDLLCSAAGYDAASALIECTSIAPGSFVGIVGSNFQPTAWDTALDASKHAVAVKSDGEVYCKCLKLSPLIKLTPLTSGCSLSLSVNMQDQELTITVLDQKQNIASSVTVENLPVEICFVVCFAPSAEAQSVKIVGSSSEKTGKKTTKKFGKDVWDDDNVQGLEGQRVSGSAAMAEVAATMM